LKSHFSKKHRLVKGQLTVHRCTQGGGGG
jgi:hypothetical protein